MLAAQPQVPAVDPDALALLSLPEDVLVAIVGGLDPSSAHILAATCSTAFSIVLEHYPIPFTFHLDYCLLRRLAHLRFSAAARSTVALRCCFDAAVGGRTEASVHLPVHKLPGICSQHLAATAGRRKGRLGRPCLLTPAALCDATVFEEEPGTGMRAVPGGMHALRTLVLARGSVLPVGRVASWLPASSAASLRVLLAAGMAMHRVPALVGLEELDVSGCTLVRQWLPADTARSIRILKVSGSNVERLPQDMIVEQLDVCGCLSLSEHWLPASSGTRVRVVDAAFSSTQELPGNMVALEQVNVVGCNDLDSLPFGAYWLPPSSAASVRTLKACRSTMRCLPPGMAVDKIDVEGCMRLDADWLPVSSGAGLRVLDASTSNMRRLPHGMAKLQELDVRGCKNLEANWLPASSRVCMPHFTADLVYEMSFVAGGAPRAYREYWAYRREYWQVY